MYYQSIGNDNVIDKNISKIYIFVMIYLTPGGSLDLHMLFSDGVEGLSLRWCTKMKRIV